MSIVNPEYDDVALRHETLKRAYANLAHEHRLLKLENERLIRVSNEAREQRDEWRRIATGGKP
jgi:hypothetical protein